MAKKNLVPLKHNELTLAEQLYTVSEQIAFLKEQETAVKKELLEDLKRQGVKSVKLDNGVQFIRSERQTLKIKDPTKAEEWAKDKNVWKVDTSAAMQVIRREIKIPSFFRIETTEYLTVKKN